jgi:chromosome segregation ATPase
MMSLLLVSLYEFKQFLQIVLWIAVPLTVIAVGMTVYLHYRRRKKPVGTVHDHPLDPSEWTLALAGSSSGTDPVSSEALPDWLASSNPDNINLLKKYEAEVRRYKEDYATLKEDYKELEFKYEDLLNKAYNGRQSGADDKAFSAQEKEKLQQQLREAEQALVNAKAEIASLRADHESLQNKYAALLQQPAANGSIPSDAGAIDAQRLQLLEQLLAKAEEENNTLRNKINEGEYLQDLAQEKKLQVDFLQQQLEQRIKTFHQLERKADEAATHLREMKDKSTSFEYRIQVLSEELTGKQHEVAKIQEEATEWRATAQISQQEQQVQQGQLEEKTLLVNQLESSLRNMQEEHEALRIDIDSRQQVMDSLKDDLLKEQQKAKELESKLELSSNLLVRIYSELARSLNAGWMQWQQGKEPLPLEIPAETMEEKSKETA